MGEGSGLGWETGLGWDRSPDPSSVSERLIPSCSILRTGPVASHGSRERSICGLRHLLLAPEGMKQQQRDGEKRQPNANALGVGAGETCPREQALLRLYTQLSVCILLFIYINQPALNKGKVKTKTKQRPEIYPSINYLQHSRTAYKYGATLDKTFMQLFRPSEI